MTLRRRENNFLDHYYYYAHLLLRPSEKFFTFRRGAALPSMDEQGALWFIKNPRILIQLIIKFHIYSEFASYTTKK